MSTRRRPGRVHHALLAAASLALAPAPARAAWDLTSVQDARGLGVSSLRFDAAGRPAIAYGEGSLTYAVWDGTAWSFEIVEVGCGGDRGASLVIDPVTGPIIS